ncbi:FkbM family methyltransferase [Anaeromyxobacter dehalogenans 2CP-1]|uniref:FkbM family methyltransferase n=1 Tax=Anaeromyxobacter dehalogenans (strain ATCC BAA-258 / DSM 21875 / 2CP-1) TaxID=455488 RepID=B8JCX3_ANAD2|nr:class I SAM-dependent methyltransferase [Anaeromyxobacter dehalogenans]ACL64001.1 FkbM family methyltransferase [Anaeromyxobacter dehalogenans 2CP-1]
MSAGNPILRLAWRAVQLSGLDDRLMRSQVPALHADGWFRSRREHRSVDLAGEPLPWISYPAIELLRRRVRPDMTVFEYGSGASTAWWARRVARVVAVEHDAGWAERVGAQLPPNATVTHVPLDDGGAYAQNVLAHGVRFDVVVIDGRQRVRCVGAAIEALRPGGVIVFDNSDRPQYEPGFRALADAGFKRVELIGLAPAIDYKTETSILYRGENCLGL